MLGSNASSLLWIAAVALIAAAIGAPIILSRRSFDKGLIGLSVVARLVALGFDPLARALPEPLSMRFFIVGLAPTLVIITVAVVANTVRVIQTRKKESLPGLLLSILAVGLFYLNSATEWIWPYKAY